MAPRKPRITIARAYDAPLKPGECRVLVDRLWPRGISKQALAIDQWLKDLAPSTALRTWYGHRPDRWDEFRKKYRQELTAHQSQLAELRKLARRQPLLLIYAARDEQHNNAVVLRDLLLSSARQRQPSQRQPAQRQPPPPSSRRSKSR